MKMLTVKEYNEQVTNFYKQDWARINKVRGYVAVTDNFTYGHWGISPESATKKFYGNSY